jgi:hypothetical protein
MVRSAFSKVMWVGRATVFMVGLAVVLALMFGVAATALAGTGVGATFNLGRTNTVDAISRLVGSTASSMLLVDNNGAGTALDLRVASNKPPMTVNPAAGTATGLSAAELEGRTWAELEPRGYAQVTTSPGIQAGSSKGVIGVVRTAEPGNVYCFDLSFTPRAAVASAHLNNNATVGTGLGSAVPDACPEGFEDAAARTYAANDSNENTMVHNDINFGIVFM